LAFQWGAEDPGESELWAMRNFWSARTLANGKAQIEAIAIAVCLQLRKHVFNKTPPSLGYVADKLAQQIG